MSQVDAGVLSEFVGQPVNDALIEVIAAELRITVGGQHVEHAVSDLQNRDIERSSAQVKDENRLFVVLV